MSSSKSSYQAIRILQAIRFSPATIYFVVILGMWLGIRHYGWVIRNTPTYVFFGASFLIIAWLALSVLYVTGLKKELDETADSLEAIRNRHLKPGRPSQNEEKIAKTIEFFQNLSKWHFARLLFQNSDENAPNSVTKQSFPLTDSAFTITPRMILGQIPAVMRVGIEHVPALFTALGILFTFYGLITGLGGVNLTADDTQELQGGLQHLLGGVGIAFESSLAGIFLSFTSLVTARVTLAQLSPTCERIRTISSQLAQNSAPEQVLQRLEKENTQSNQLMKRLVELSEDQVTKLGTLGTEIVTALDEKFNAALSTNVAAPLNQMSQNLSDFADRQLNTHTEALDDILTNFNEQFSQNLGDEFQKLGAVLHHVIQWQEETRELYENVWHKLEQQSQSQSEALEIQVQLLEVQKAADQRHIQQLNEFNQRSDTAIEKLDRFSETVGMYMQSIESTSVELAEAKDALSRALASVDDFGANIAEATRAVTVELQQQLHGVEEALTGSIREFQQSLELLPERYQKLLKEIRLELHDGLKNTFGEFDKETARIVEHLSGSYIQMDGSLNNFNDSLKSLSEQFKQLNQENAPKPQKTPAPRTPSAPVDKTENLVKVPGPPE